MGLTDAGWEGHAKDFRKTHANSLNVALHLITTPACFLATFGLINFAASSNDAVKAQTGADGTHLVSVAIAAVYMASLFMTSIPFSFWFATGASMAALVFASTIITLTPLQLCVLFAGAYFGQDLAHYISGDASYQSTYSGSDGFLSKLAEHTFFLLPLVFDAVFHMNESFLSWFASHNYVVYAKLGQATEKADLKRINDWVMDQKPTKANTTHYWFRERTGTPAHMVIPQVVYDAFTNVALSKSMLGMFYERFNNMMYAVERVSDMDEIYVSSPNYNHGKSDKNSDTVFYMRHIDGPYLIFPFARVYRTIVACSPNEMISTTCPMQPATYTLSTGEALGFDFNREVHFIHNQPGVENKGFRITLKVHYVVYPKFLRFYGRLLAALTTRYDETARNLFVNTINPPNMFWKAAAYYVLISTKLTQLSMEFIGMENLFFILCSLAASAYYGNGAIFLYSTSFIHYFYYYGTYYHRRNVSHGYFMRDVKLFKGLSMAHLAYHYASVGGLDCLLIPCGVKAALFGAATAVAPGVAPDMWSIGALVVGYGLACMAAEKLGWDQTYFGVELGVCRPRWVNSFPYGYVPHPMIVGGVIGLCGFHKFTPFATKLPYLVPIHVTLYLTHLMQEMCDFHSGRVPFVNPEADSEQDVGSDDDAAKFGFGDGCAAEEDLPGDFTPSVFNKHGFLEGHETHEFLYPVRSKHIHYE